jgi:hypothetical protein
MSESLSREQAVSVSRVSALVVINALIFQEILSNDDGRVQSLRRMLQGSDFVGAIEDQWRFILDKIDYFPIFDVASAVLVSLSSSSDTDRALRSLANIALNVVRQRAALRHDLMGRVYHRLLGERETKSLATFYTSVPAATLLLKLALDPSRWTTNWSDEKQLSEFRIADLACGTGTLLMAAAEVITDNYVRSCVQESRSPDFDILQRILVQYIIFGYDVLPSARHLTASTLALRVPKVSFQSMNLWSLPLGEPGQRLGSIEFLIDKHIAIQDFRKEAGAIERASATERSSEEAAYLPDLDLCVMNPPFTRSSHANLLFGSLPDNERLALQRRLARLLRKHEVEATGTAGLGSVFVAVGDRALKENGRIALVLPKALLSGGSWQQTRELFQRAYNLEYLIVSHDPERWNFSDNTSLSEVLVVARKVAGSSLSEEASDGVICVNLRRNPRTVFESLGVADSLARNPVPSIRSSQGTLDITVGDTKFGEAVSVSWNRLKQRLWILPCAFAQVDLLRAVHHLLDGIFYLPAVGITDQRVPLTVLNKIGELGPDIRDIYDGFQITKGQTLYAAFWGHDANTVTTIAQQPNTYLSPLSVSRRGRHLRQASDLWPKAARVAIATRLRVNTQRIAAIRVDSKILSNVWWPFLLFDETEEAEKSLVLWLNSTLGLLILLAHRQEVQGSWVAFQKPILNNLPILDLGVLPKEKTKALAKTYDLLAFDTILPFPNLVRDGTRQKIDEAIVEALDLPDISVLRELLSREPIVSSRPLC